MFSMSNLWFHENNSIKIFLCPIFTHIRKGSYLLEGSPVFFSACPSSKSCTEIKKNMEQLWNATERGKPLLAQFFHHESRMDWSGVEFRLLR